MIAILIACAPASRPDILVHPVDHTTLVTTITVPPPDPTTTTTTTTTTTSTSTTVPDPPRITAVDLVELDDVLEVHVHTKRGTATLNGGTLELTLDDDPPLELLIPDDLASFDGEDAVVLLDRPHVGECTLGADHEVTADLIDVAGLASASKTEDITTTDVGIILPENGDSSAPLLGLVPAYVEFCSDLDSIGNNGTVYTADIDYVAFEVPSTANWTLNLRWPAIGDYDLYVYEIGSDGYWDLLDSDHDPDVHSPEQVITKLKTGHTYAFEVAGWSGDAGDWTVQLVP